MVYLYEEKKKYPTVFPNLRPCYNRHRDSFWDVDHFDPGDVNRFDPGGVFFVWLVPSQTILLQSFSGTLLDLREKPGTKQN